MADVDTKVLYLENPPTTAPPASYLIGVRVKNLGIAAASTSGYVSVYDKGTSLLVGTFNVASAEMDPDEEKQAFATVALDLTEAEVGQQFIFSGDITSPGDMVRSNDILAPTTITIVDEPPPPPPPVASHASQHEDAGSDELDVTGLHGVLGTPQPYADHASGHENGGADEVNVAGMTGQLADPQIAADHGNERHVVDFLLATELNNHIADATPHDAATSLEKTAEKGAANGYAELGAAGKVPVGQLGGAEGTGQLFLKSDQTWANPPGVAVPPGDIDPSIARWNPDYGASGISSRKDHKHQMGGLYSSYGGGSFFNQLVQLAAAQIDTGIEGVAQRRWAMMIRLFGRIIGNNVLTLTWTGQFGHPVPGWFPLVMPTIVTTPAMSGQPLELQIITGGSRNIFAGTGSHTHLVKANVADSVSGDFFNCSEIKAVTPSQAFDPLFDSFLEVYLNINGDAANYFALDNVQYWFGQTSDDQDYGGFGGP